MTATRLARAATAVALFGLVSRFLGLGREIVLASVYGASADADAFVTSLLLVNVVAAVLLYALVTIVIPGFSNERERAGERSAWSLVWALTAWVGMFLIVISALIALFPQVPTALFGLDPERAALTADLVRIMAPAILFQGISALFTALLQIHGKFGVPAAVGVAFNLGIIIGVLLGQGSLGIEAAAWGVTIGALAQVALQLPQFFRLARRTRVRPRLMHPRLVALALLALPVAGASVLQQVNNFTDKLFASTLPPGGVSSLAYANALGAAPRAALLVPFLTPIFPLVAKLIAEGRRHEATRSIHRVMGLLGLTAVPAALLLAVWATETTQLLLGRGQCDTQCVTDVAGPLRWYALAILGNFLSIFLNRSLAAAELQRQILWATVASVAVTILFDAILVGPMAQSGIAAATFIGVYLNLAIYLWYLRAHFPEADLPALGRQVLRLLACGAVCLAAALVANLVLPTPEGMGGVELLVRLGAKAVFAVAAYALAARFLAPRELGEVGNSLRALFRRRRAAAPG